VLATTARWLATSEGFTRHGTAPSAAQMQEPRVSLYYAACYLAFLKVRARPRALPPATCPS